MPLETSELRNLISSYRKQALEFLNQNAIGDDIPMEDLKVRFINFTL